MNYSAEDYDKGYNDYCIGYPYNNIAAPSWRDGWLQAFHEHAVQTEEAKLSLILDKLNITQEELRILKKYFNERP